MTPTFELNFPNPVSSRADLFDRVPHLNKIEETMRSPARHAVVIKGERVMGKTSLLNVTIHSARQAGNVLVLQLPHVRSRDSFIEEILDGMAAEAHTSLHRLGLRDSAGRLRMSVTEFPRVADHLSNAAGSSFLLCLDELDSMLLGCPDDAAVQILDFILRLVTDTTLRIKFVATLTRTTPQIMRSDASPFLSAARIVNLIPWSDAEVREFVAWLAQDRFTFTDDAHKLLFDAGGGHPYLTKAILHGLREHPLGAGRSVTGDDIRAAVQVATVSPEVTFTLDNVIGVHFTPDEQRLLWWLAVSPAPVRASDPSVSTDALHELVAREYLRVSGDGLVEHTYGLIGHWLRHQPWSHRWPDLTPQTAAEWDDLTSARLVVDHHRGLVFLGQRELNVTPQEYRFLRFLVAHAGAVVDRHTIAQEVWPDEKLIDGVREGRLDALVYRLREELGTEASSYIETRRGRGYYANPRLVVLAHGGRHD